MKKISILWVILIIFLTTLLTLIGFYVMERNKPYKDLEANIVEGMKIYFGQDSNLKKLPKKNKEVKITIEELKEFGVKINTDINNDSCVGFGIIKGKDLTHTYQAFISCENYTTDKYNEYK